MANNVLLRWKLTPDSVENLVNNPQNRTEQARNLIQAFGGKLESYYFALGDIDGCGIAQFPDAISIAACRLKAQSTGAFRNFEATVLLTGQEAEQAMQRAGEAEGKYQAPNGNNND